MPSEVSWEEESRSARDGRRSRLAELDWALEVLEELNLRGDATVPAWIRERLEKMGIRVRPQETPTGVLEKVLVVQEVYLLHPVEVYGGGRRDSPGGAAGPG